VPRLGTDENAKMTPAQTTTGPQTRIVDGTGPMIGSGLGAR